MNPCRHANEYPIVISDAERASGQLSKESTRVASLLLHTRGYVILRGAVPLGLAQESSRAFRHVFQDCVASQNGDGWYQQAQETKAIFWQRNHRWRIFPKLTPPFNSHWLVANPFALTLIQKAFGHEHTLSCKFVSSDTCLKGAKVQSPHRELNAGRTWDRNVYVVNIPLCRCGLDNGPLEVWYGGSHLWSQEILDALEFNDDVQDAENTDAEQLAEAFPSRLITLEPGDLLIRDPGLLHRSTVNQTDEPRSMLTICYFCEGHAHEYGKVEYNMDRELWASLDPQVKILFAHAFDLGSRAK
jgi:ectoine hydroxylase-related dioxygenase (phytanoyl-CoA dioxygenase family)